jgi:hypothetical protein
MAPLKIKLGHRFANDACALCGKRLSATANPHLCMDEGEEEAVCRECGKVHAPPLVALLDLARVAERVGRVSRHTLVPPLHTLLDMARAAEDYVAAAPVRKRQVA